MQIIFGLVFLILFIPLDIYAGWQFVTPMPKARYGHDATLGPDGKIYVMGGIVFDVREDGRLGHRYMDGLFSCVVYDRGKDKWEFMEPVIGFKRPNNYMIYDPEADQWRHVRKVQGEDNYFEVFNPTKEPRYTRLPDSITAEQLRETGVERQGDGVAIVASKDGMIYWLGGGGIGPKGGEDLVIPYDPIKKKWPAVEYKRVQLSEYSSTGENIVKTDIPPMLERRMDHEAVVTSDGKIYVLGGRRMIGKLDSYGKLSLTPEQEVTDTVEYYDPKTNKWEYRKSMTKKKFAFGAVVGPDNKIYTFGGSGDFLPNYFRETYCKTEVYDPKTDTWTSLAPMPEPRERHKAALGSNGKIYILGGVSEINGPPLATVFIYDSIEDRWSKGPSMRLPRDTLAAVSTPDGKIYAIGGTDKGAYESKEQINFFLPKKAEFYTGRVQNTVEMLDVFEK